MIGGNGMGEGLLQLFLYSWALLFVVILLLEQLVVWLFIKNSWPFYWHLALCFLLSIVAMVLALFLLYLSSKR